MQMKCYININFILPRTDPHGGEMPRAYVYALRVFAFFRGRISASWGPTFSTAC